MTKSHTIPSGVYQTCQLLATTKTIQSRLYLSSAAQPRCFNVYGPICIVVLDHVGIGAAFLETSDETPYHSVGRKPSSSMFLIVEASSFGTTEAARSFVVRGGMLFLRIGCVMTNVTTLLVNDSCLVVLVLVLSTRPERNSMFARESRFSSPTSQEHSISRRHNPLVASITEWILGPPPWCVRVSRVERYGR